MSLLPSSGSTSPAVGAFAVTPSDTVDLAVPARGIYVGASGDLKVDIGGDAITFVDIAAGVIHPLNVTRVYSTGTTATNIIGVF